MSIKVTKVGVIKTLMKYAINSDDIYIDDDKFNKITKYIANIKIMTDADLEGLYQTAKDDVKERDGNVILSEDTFVYNTWINPLFTAISTTPSEDIDEIPSTPNDDAESIGVIEADLIDDTDYSRLPKLLEYKESDLSYIQNCGDKSFMYAIIASYLYQSVKACVTSYQDMVKIKRMLSYKQYLNTVYDKLSSYRVLDRSCLVGDCRVNLEPIRYIASIRRYEAISRREQKMYDYCSLESAVKVCNINIFIYAYMNKDAVDKTALRVVYPHSTRIIKEWTNAYILMPFGSDNSIYAGIYDFDNFNKGITHPGRGHRQLLTCPFCLTLIRGENKVDAAEKYRRHKDTDTCIQYYSKVDPLIG